MDHVSSCIFADVFTRGSNEYGQLGQLQGEPDDDMAPIVSSATSFTRVFTSTRVVPTVALQTALAQRQTRARLLADAEAHAAAATHSSSANTSSSSPPSSIVERATDWAVSLNANAIQREQAAVQQVTRAIADAMRTPGDELVANVDEERAEPLPPAATDPVCASIVQRPLV